MKSALLRFLRFAPAVALVILSGAVGGCRSAGPPPTTEMAQAETAVQRAETENATEYAGVELRRAKQKLEDARRALSEKEHVRARRLAEQAAVDAELAVIKARTTKTQQAAAELRESIRALQQEAARENN